MREDRARILFRDARDRTPEAEHEVGGTVTSEHGTGAVGAFYMRAEHGGALDEAIKNVMDPKGLLNTG